MTASCTTEWVRWRRDRLRAYLNMHIRLLIWLVLTLLLLLLLLLSAGGG